MIKKNKILIYILTGTAFLGLIFIVVAGLAAPSSSKNSSSTVSKVPDYVLDRSEEDQVRQFVQNFVSLYNSYSSSDLSNLQALEDYETPSMQLATDQLVADRSRNLAEGLTVRSESNVSTFHYTYPQAQQLFVTMEAKVSENNSTSHTMNNYSVTATLTLKKTANRWLADNITFQKY